MKRKEMTKIVLTDQAGLTAQQAKQQLEQVGANELVAAKKPALWRQVIRHLSDVSSMVLLFAVGLASYMALAQGGLDEASSYWGDSGDQRNHWVVSGSLSRESFSCLTIDELANNHCPPRWSGPNTGG